jgi:hypothetical protein
LKRFDKKKNSLTLQSLWQHQFFLLNFEKDLMYFFFIN